MRTLILYRPSDGYRLDIGRFFAPRELDGEIRCDLHPRWSRDGQKICFDSVHEGHRQIYVVDVSEIVL
jgi:Tol biopolymer transport system component